MTAREYIFSGTIFETAAETNIKALQRANAAGEFLGAEAGGEGEQRLYKVSEVRKAEYVCRCGHRIEMFPRVTGSVALHDEFCA